MFKPILNFILSFFVFYSDNETLQLQNLKTDNFFQLSAKDLSTGRNVQFSTYNDRKAFIVVNVACQCGFTKDHYSGLINIYNKYKKQGLQIFGYHCNLFANQQNGTSDEISQFIVDRFQVTFPIFQKIQVNGQNTHPVYLYLRKNSELFDKYQVKLVKYLGILVNFFQTEMVKQLDSILQQLIYKLYKIISKIYSIQKKNYDNLFFIFQQVNFVIRIFHFIYYLKKKLNKNIDRKNLEQDYRNYKPKSMELQVKKSQLYKKRNIQSRIQKKSQLMIEHCFNCYQHTNYIDHDEQLFHDLISEIKQEIKNFSLKSIKIRQNKPFKYLSNTYESVLSQKTRNKASNNIENNYFNQITKKIQRFPRINSFEVCFENFVVFSKLNLDFIIQVKSNQIQNERKQNQERNNLINKDKQMSDVKEQKNQNININTNQIQVQKKEMIQKSSQTTTLPNQKVQKQISTHFLAKLIVQVIKILKKNIDNLQFIQKVENIFRFLQMQWKPFTFQCCIVQYLLKSSSQKTNFFIESIEQIIQPLISLTRNQKSNLPWSLNTINNFRQVNPYIFYKQAEKKQRIKSIYKKNTNKKKYSSLSDRSSTSKISIISKKSILKQQKLNDHILTMKNKHKSNNKKRQSIKVQEQCKIESKNKIKSKSKIEQQNQPKQQINLKDNYEQKVTPHNPKNQQKKIIRVTKDNHFSLIKIKKSEKNQTEQIQREIKQTKNYQKTTIRQTQKPEGFILKRNHLRRTSVPQIQTSALQNSFNDLRKSGFIYKKQQIKECLLRNQFIFQKFEQKIEKRRQKEDIGKIFYTSRVSLKKQFRNTEQQFLMNDACKNINKYEQKKQPIFRRSNQVETKETLKCLKHRNLVRQCLSQNRQRPLSSTITSKRVHKKQHSINRNSLSVSEKQIKENKMTQSEAQSNFSTQNRYQTIKLNRKQSNQLNLKQQNDHINAVLQNKLTFQQKKYEENNPKKSPIKKYSKDFIKKNIQKAPLTKRFHSFGLSPSYWEQLNKQTILNSKHKDRTKSIVKDQDTQSQQKSISNRQKSIIREQQCNKFEKRQSTFFLSHRKNHSAISHQSRKQNSFSCEKSKSKLKKSYSVEKMSQILNQTQKKIQKNQLIFQARGTISQDNFQKIIEVNEDNFKDQDKDVFNEQKLSESLQSLNQAQKYNKLDQNRQDQCLQTDFELKNDTFLSKSPLKYDSNIITYTLGSQQDENLQVTPSSQNFQNTCAYYNHKLYLSLQSFIKYQPAYILQHFSNDFTKLQSQEFSHMLKQKNFDKLQNIATFSYEKEEIYQKFTVKSLKQIYKLDEICLFPSNNLAKSQQSFSPEEVKSLYWQQDNCLLSEVVHILMKINRKIISRLFQNAKSLNYLGYYGIWLFNTSSNKFQLIIVNDQFALAIENHNIQSLNSTDFIFSNPLKRNAVWYMILEKAIAKILGGYGNIDKCTFGQIFKILTGCQYIQFKDIDPQKICKILNQKVLNNKKTYAYATALNQNRNDQTNNQNYTGRVQRITGWNFNQKNPFLSLVHFQSSSNRIQSIAMMDFIKQFDGITMVFFNPNFYFNQISLSVQKQGKISNKFIKALQIFSGSYNKDCTCYISVKDQNTAKINNEEENYGQIRDKKNLKTNIKIYAEILSYNSQFNGKSANREEQNYSDLVQEQSFKYNGQITKNGEFFFQVLLKGGKNVCIIQSQYQTINLGFYGEEMIQVKDLCQKQFKKLKLLNGKQYMRKQESNQIATKEKHNQQNEKQNPKNQINQILKQTDLNSKDTKQKSKLKTKKHTQVQKQNIEKVQNKSAKRRFLEDQMNQNEFLQRNQEKIKLKHHKKGKIM